MNSALKVLCNLPKDNIIWWVLGNIINACEHVRIICEKYFNDYTQYY